MEVITAGVVVITVTAFNLAIAPQSYALVVQGAFTGQLQVCSGFWSSWLTSALQRLLHHSTPENGTSFGQLQVPWCQLQPCQLAAEHWTWDSLSESNQIRRRAEA